MPDPDAVPDLAVLTAPLAIGALSAPSRVVFGPHETNLGRGRSISERHVAYYARRAAGGAGVIITEEASVHESDWPYERAPLATECAHGWSMVLEACAPHGTLVLAALGHAGGQGTSHWSQRELWAPGRVPEVNTREVPKEMEDRDIEAVIAGFVTAARIAVRVGCHGVELNAGQFSLARQFLSGLTNNRGDRWGQDRSAFLRRVIAEVRDAIGSDKVLALRLSCDELAPWAGITPEMAPGIAAELVTPNAPESVLRDGSPEGTTPGSEGITGRHATEAAGQPAVSPEGPLVDMLTVVRGSIYTAGATRPDGHIPEGFNNEVARAVADAVSSASGGATVVVAQGSIVEPSMAAGLLGDSAIAAVEMTRAQIADAELVAKVRAGEPERVRPCVLCNQLCAVRDNRNPIVSCVVDPFSGHETTESIPDAPAPISREVLVVGGGPAGLEAARVAAHRGHTVRVAERSERLGGRLHTTASQPGRSRFARFEQWLESECARTGVQLIAGWDFSAGEIPSAGGDVSLVLATGGRNGEPSYAITRAATVLAAAEVLDDPASAPAGDVLVWDPIGGPTGVAVAEILAATGRTVHIATPDYIVGNELARSGDLGPANARLANAGVVMHRRRNIEKVRKAAAVLADRFSHDTETIEVDWVVDCGHRLPEDALEHQVQDRTGHRPAVAGDCVAPRTVAEAVLEGRRRALEID